MVDLPKYNYTVTTSEFQVFQNSGTYVRFPSKGNLTFSFEFMRDIALNYLNNKLKPKHPYVCKWVPPDGRCMYHALYVFVKLYNLESKYISCPTSSENLKTKMLKYVLIYLFIPILLLILFLVLLLDAKI